MKKLLFTTLMAFSLAACGDPPPESRVALSEPGAAAYDERLVGIWYALDPREAIYLHITPRKETAYLDVLGIWAVFKGGDIFAAGQVNWLRATAHASEVDGRTYYNVKRVAGAGVDYTAPEESPGFIIVRADVSEQDTPILCFMGKNIVRNLIKEGRVKGRAVKGDNKGAEVPYRVLDLSRPELVALIREVTPEKLFPNCGFPYHRLVPTVDKSN